MTGQLTLFCPCLSVPVIIFRSNDGVGIGVWRVGCGEKAEQWHGVQLNTVLTMEGSGFQQLLADTQIPVLTLIYDICSRVPQQGPAAIRSLLQKHIKSAGQVLTLTLLFLDLFSLFDLAAYRKCECGLYVRVELAQGHLQHLLLKKPVCMHKRATTYNANHQEHQ